MFLFAMIGNPVHLAVHALQDDFCKKTRHDVASLSGRIERRTMICVSIGRTRHKMMTAEHRALADRGAELVELRVDWLSRPPDLNRLITDRPTPVIITCRRASDKGHWKEGEDQRKTLLRAAIVAGVEYVDLEEDVAASIPRYGKTKRIISYHNFDETPLDLDEIHARLSKLDPDVVKIATMANSPNDNIRMLKLVAEAKIPTAGFCMGELGVLSRILTGRYGSPFTYATWSADRTLAPGQLTFDQMRDVFHYDSIDRETKIYGVLGDPIAHSMSPLIHNKAFEKAGLNSVYIPFRVPQDALSLTLDSFSWLDVQGYSVTLPHKEAVLSKVLKGDEATREIGAANTLYRKPNGDWRAANTDYDAAMQSLRLGLESGLQDGTGGHLAGKKVLLLGAGGAARAIGLGIIRAGCGLMISNRTKNRAVELATSLKCQQVPWENRGTVFADILINCTSVGMHPSVDESPFVQNWLREGMLVFDTIYNPEQTLLIKQARDRGCKTVTGIEMFVRQAARQFELFTGLEPPLDIMRETLRQAISPVRLN